MVVVGRKQTINHIVKHQHYTIPSNSVLLIRPIPNNSVLLIRLTWELTKIGLSSEVVCIVRPNYIEINCFGLSRWP